MHFKNQSNLTVQLILDLMFVYEFGKKIHWFFQLYFEKNHFWNVVLQSCVKLIFTPLCPISLVKFMSYLRFKNYSTRACSVDRG